MGWHSYDPILKYNSNINAVRVHAKWVEGEEWREAEVDESYPQWDDEDSTKSISNLFDDNENTYTILTNSCLKSGWQTEGPLTFTIYPCNSSATASVTRHLLFLRLKADISPWRIEISGQNSNFHKGYFYVEYIKSDGTVIKALGNRKTFDGWLPVYDDVVEVRLVGQPEEFPEYESEHKFIKMGFYKMKPYFAVPSDVYCRVSDRTIRFAVPQTYDWGVQNPVYRGRSGNVDLMVTSVDNPFASPVKFMTDAGIKALVEYNTPPSISWDDYRRNDLIMLPPVIHV